MMWFCMPLSQELDLEAVEGFLASNRNSCYSGQHIFGGTFWDSGCIPLAAGGSLQNTHRYENPLNCVLAMSLGKAALSGATASEDGGHPTPGRRAASLWGPLTHRSPTGLC